MRNSFAASRMSARPRTANKRANAPPIPPFGSRDRIASTRAKSRNANPAIHRAIACRSTGVSSMPTATGLDGRMNVADAFSVECGTLGHRRGAPTTRLRPLRRARTVGTFCSIQCRPRFPDGPLRRRLRHFRRAGCGRYPEGQGSPPSRRNSPGNRPLGRDRERSRPRESPSPRGLRRPERTFLYGPPLSLPPTRAGSP